MAVGLGVRGRYDGDGVGVRMVGGVLDAMSAGVLVYTALVEVIAREFVCNPGLTREMGRLVGMVVFFLMGTGWMSLLGKWT